MLWRSILHQAANPALPQVAHGWHCGRAAWQDVAEAACPCDVAGAFSL
jgi:hypothetical protein